VVAKGLPLQNNQLFSLQQLPYRLEELAVQDQCDGFGDFHSHAADGIRAQGGVHDGSLNDTVIGFLVFTLTQSPFAASPAQDRREQLAPDAIAGIPEG